MPLSDKHLSELERLLEQRLALLIEQVRNALEQSQSRQFIELLDRAPADVGDQSVADALADLNLAFIDRQIRELRDIEAARERMRGGTYGVCIDCGEDIDVDRLRVYPTAKRCVRCQQIRERTYAHEGTPTL